MALTAETVRTFFTHLLIGLLVGFGLSVLFWVGFGTFVPAGFVLWSVVSALAGALAGYFVFRSYLWTVLVAAIIRIGIYVVMTQMV